MTSEILVRYVNTSLVIINVNHLYKARVKQTRLSAVCLCLQTCLQFFKVWLSVSVPCLHRTKKSLSVSVACLPFQKIVMSVSVTCLRSKLNGPKGSK